MRETSLILFAPIHLTFIRRGHFSRKSSYNSYYLVAILSPVPFPVREAEYHAGKNEANEKKGMQTQIATVTSRRVFSITGKLRRDSFVDFNLAAMRGMWMQ